MKFIGESYSSYAKDIQKIWCRSAKFLWKSKFCSESGSGSGPWYYFGFQYTYISYMEDTRQILFGSTNSFKSYCVHMKSPRTYVHPDRRKFFLACFVFQDIKIVNICQKERIFFFHSCDYNTFAFYIRRMWWESKKLFTVFDTDRGISHALKSMWRTFDKCSCFVCLRRQNKQKKFPPVCLYVRTYVEFSCGHNNFRKS